MPNAHFLEQNVLVYFVLNSLLQMGSSCGFCDDFFSGLVFGNVGSSPFLLHSTLTIEKKNKSNFEDFQSSYLDLTKFFIPSSIKAYSVISLMRRNVDFPQGSLLPCPSEAAMKAAHSPTQQIRGGVWVSEPQS